MVLRKPYAFLIKHFRLIHMILFVLLAYVTAKAYNIMDFFKDYINIKGNMEVIASNYTSPLIFISIFLIIALSLFVYFLMRYKKKPRTLYIITITLTLISSMVIVYLVNNIRSLETIIMSAKKLRLLRDISKFNYWALFIMCFPILVRGLGFDIKKFNFTSDLADLKLEETDNEEVEVNVDLTSEGIKRGGNKIKRELTYYYAENKLIINIILSIVGIILILMFPFNKFVINRNLNEGNTLNTNYFNLTITDSYISERNRISIDNSYVILKIQIKGKMDKYTPKLDNFVLEGKHNDYIPSLKYYQYFNDLGYGYKKQYLDVTEFKEYLLMYNIKNEDKDSKFKIHYLEDDRYIKINPEIIK